MIHCQVRDFIKYNHENELRAKPRKQVTMLSLKKSAATIDLLIDFSFCLHNFTYVHAFYQHSYCSKA